MMIFKTNGFFLKHTAIFIGILFLHSCQTEELVTSQQKSTTEAKTWFDKYQSTGKNYDLFQDLNYDWSSAKITDSEDGTQTIIIPVKELIQNEAEIWKQKLFVYKLSNTTYQALLFEIYPDKEANAKGQSIDGGNFNGYISSWDLKTGFVRAARFVNDQVVENGAAKVISKDKIKTNKTPATPRCPEGDCSDGSGTAIPLREVVINNNYQNNTGVTLYFVPSGTVNNGGSSTDYTSHSGGGGGGISAPTSLQIIDALTGKAKCLNALLNKNGDSFVQKLLANFEGKSEFDIKIVSKDKVTVTKNGITKEVNGATLPLNGKEIVIEISTTRTNEHSALDAVRTILHEYIHADIQRKLYTLTSTDEEKNDFKKLYDLYGNQHGTMAGLYLQSMKKALKEFHKNVLTDDYNKYTDYYGEAPSDAFYEALAWGGLKENDVKDWTDLPEDKKATIEKLANRAILLSKTVPCP
ncbi:MAG: hypothetical protein ABI576_04935 [Flavobacterium sp.]